jgi:hypothetical protein
LSDNDRTDKMCNRTVFREPTLRIAQDKQGAPLHICLSLPTGDRKGRPYAEQSVYS